MSKAAQLAQKSRMYIASTAGAAKTITAVSIGYPAVVTSTAHGLANGDVVVIAALVGTIGTDATNGLNGKTYVINHVLANSFVIEANTTGLVYTSGGTATPNTWTQIKELKAIKPGGASTSKIDVSDLDSDAAEYRVGLVDNGTLSADGFDSVTDAGQTAVLAAFNAQTVNTYKLALTGGSTRTFDAVVTKFGTLPDVAVNGVQTQSVEWQISGAVVRS
jgi:hypothetical protein